MTVFGRTVERAGTDELQLEPWTPTWTPVHRSDETNVNPVAVPLTGWPTDPVEFDTDDPKLVWRIEGTWLAGNSVAFGSKTLVQDPLGRHYVMVAEEGSTRPPPVTVSPFDDVQLRELKRLRLDGAALTTRVRRGANGEKVWQVVAFDEQEVSRALALRPDQAVSVVPAEWTADSVQRTQQTIRDRAEQWPLLSTGQRNGADGGPFAFTLRVGWLTPELLQLFQTTPPGLLALDVWLGPAEDG